MPTLINTDIAGNTFYNYLTPLVKGEAGKSIDNMTAFLNQAIGSSNHLLDAPNFHRYIRFPAPGIETKTGTVSSNASTYRIRVNETVTSFNQYFGGYPRITTGNSSANTTSFESIDGSSGDSSSKFCFRVANSYSFASATFSSNELTTLDSFVYFGWLKEPQYTGNPYPRGLVFLQSQTGTYFRPTTENATGTTALQSAANTITTPSITCSISTPGADTTDVIIRDGVSPNNAIGKLYNCVVLPAACVVGGIYKNTGVDPEGSNQDKFLCIMNWGTKKLGMRIWSEGFV